MAHDRPRISGKRLSQPEYVVNFADIHPPFDDHEVQPVDPLHQLRSAAETGGGIVDASPADPRSFAWTNGQVERMNRMIKDATVRS